MRRITASEARRNWFRLLDQVAEGDVVVIMRKGRRIVIRREEPRRHRRQTFPDYSGILTLSDGDTADRWSWRWDGSLTGVPAPQKTRKKGDE